MQFNAALINGILRPVDLFSHKVSFICKECIYPFGYLKKAYSITQFLNHHITFLSLPAQAVRETVLSYLKVCFNTVSHSSYKPNTIHLRYRFEGLRPFNTMARLFQ